MRVFSVNHSSYGSTGMIMLGIHEELLRQGHESWVAWPRGRDPKNLGELRFNTEWGIRAHALMGRLDDRTGFHSTGATKQLVSMIEDAQPDVVHLHNIHGYCLDVSTLFPALRRMQVPVVWTLHSCWAFTGHCTHFTYARCQQWKNCCSKKEKCPQIHSYPMSLFRDNSARNFEQKRFLFTDMPNMQLTVPSVWLANQVAQSFLKNYPITVIPSGVDTTVFRPVQSDIRESLGISGDKIMVLGVASPWSSRKGWERFIELSSYLDAARYQIAMVGLNERELKIIPDSIVGISRTENQKQLAELYSMADVCLSLSEEETQGLTVVESICCGTPAVVLNSTALPESIRKGLGVIAQSSSVEDIKVAIDKAASMNIRSTTQMEFYRVAYDKNSSIEKYLRVYR